MRREEMRRDEMRWDEMRWDEIRWDEISVLKASVYFILTEFIVWLVGFIDLMKWWFRAYCTGKKASLQFWRAIKESETTINLWSKIKRRTVLLGLVRQRCMPPRKSHSQLAGAGGKTTRKWSTGSATTTEPASSAAAAANFLSWALNTVRLCCWH